jgi:hypothetical protein
MAPSELPGAMSGHLPEWLPNGFGLVGAWQTTPQGAGAIWVDATCREVSVWFSRTGTINDSPVLSVGPWAVIDDVPDGCGNAVMGMGRCVDYQAAASPGQVSVQTIGMERSVGDYIVLSIPL